MDKIKGRVWKFGDSVSTDSMERLSWRPRIFGMMQKLQVWSQPSEIFKYALKKGPVRTRGIARSGSRCAAPP